MPGETLSIAIPSEPTKRPCSERIGGTAAAVPANVRAQRPKPILRNVPICRAISISPKDCRSRLRSTGLRRTDDAAVHSVVRRFRDDPELALRGDGEDLVV